jgi:hypothetical protein
MVYISVKENKIYFFWHEYSAAKILHSVLLSRAEKVFWLQRKVVQNISKKLDQIYILPLIYAYKVLLIHVHKQHLPAVAFSVSLLQTWL